MGIDLALYRLRIGAYNMKTKCNKMVEKSAVSGVSTCIIIQILMILLVIGGVELNPGPDKQPIKPTKVREEIISTHSDVVGRSTGDVSTKVDRVQQNWRDSHNKVREVRNEMDYHPAATSRPDLAPSRSRTKTRQIQESSQNDKERRKRKYLS